MGLAKTVYNEGNIKHMAEDIKRELAEAARAMVNIQANGTMRQARENIGNNFTIRNNFTKRQVQYTQMPEGNHDLSDIRATTGITEKAGYMARQEEGGERTPRRGQTLAIPMNTARGGSNRRPVLKSMRVSKITRRRRVHGSDTSIVARAFVAFTKGLFLSLGGTNSQRNLHKVTSFRRGAGGQIRFTTEQIYKFDLSSTTTEARPWLLPATEKWAKLGQKIFNTQAKKRGL